MLGVVRRVARVLHFGLHHFLGSLRRCHCRSAGSEWLAAFGAKSGFRGSFRIAGWAEHGCSPNSTSQRAKGTLLGEYSPLGADYSRAESVRYRPEKPLKGNLIAGSVLVPFAAGPALFLFRLPLGLEFFVAFATEFPSRVMLHIASEREP